MPEFLPSLRNDIEVMPSPSPEQPGLLFRDPYRYTEAMLIIPPVLVPALSFFDGAKTASELLAFLTRHIGHKVPDDVVDDLVKTLDSQGFLDTPNFQAMREARREAFRSAPRRNPVHAGSAYAAEPEGLRIQLSEYMEKDSDGHPPRELIGIAAPHVSPVGGWKSYASAYRRLSAVDGDKTFVILGTSHYGVPEKFGMTRKPFVTPLGTLSVDTPMVDWIASRAGDSVVMEDYCHSIEHSIEFQCVFLQHMLGRDCRILPILCGPFLESLLTDKAPEQHGANQRFFDTLGELAEREGSRLFFVLGIDLAHIGSRYGDRQAVQAEQGQMIEVRSRDHERLDRICSGDREGFLSLVTPEHDALRWCGYSPLYTFLKTVPASRGNLLNYEQWNIDEESVVSFAALEFYRKD